MQPARFRQADISLVKIDNAQSMSPAVSSGRSAGSFPEQRLVIEPTRKEAVKGRPTKEQSCNDFCRVCRCNFKFLQLQSCFIYRLNYQPLFLKEPVVLPGLMDLALLILTNEISACLNRAGCINHLSRSSKEVVRYDERSR